MHRPLLPSSEERDSAHAQRRDPQGRHGWAQCGRQTARKFEFSSLQQAVQFEPSRSLAALRGQVEVLRLAASAWLAQARKQTTEAIDLMRSAADLEDTSEKHIAMENRLYAMRELLADLLLESGQPTQALAEYEASMSASPNRFNALVGAAKAAIASDNPNKASDYSGHSNEAQS
jgi:hypothetical protein